MGLILNAFFPPVMCILGISLVWNIYRVNKCFDRIHDDLTEAIACCERIQYELRRMR